MTIFMLLRIVGAVLGVLAAISLARSGLGFRFREEFVVYLEWIEFGIARFVWPLQEYIVKPALEALREFGIDIDLQDHWRGVFVLLWLFNSSYVGAFASPVRVALEKNISLRQRWIAFCYSASTWLSAFLIALLAGVLAGSVMLAHDAVFWWPITGFFLFVAIRAFLAAYFQDPLHARPGRIALVFAAGFAAVAVGWIDPPQAAGAASLLWWAVLAYFAYAASLVLTSGVQFRSADGLPIAALTVCFAVAGFMLALALGVVATPSHLIFTESPSPGLANLAAFVLFLGSVDLASAAFWVLRGEGGFLERVLHAPKAQAALQVLCVLGVAAAIIWFARA